MFPIPWGVRVRVRIGEPIARRPDDATALVERVRGEMLATLARWRDAAAPGPPRASQFGSQEPVAPPRAV